MNRTKRLFIVLLILIFAFWTYVEIVNRNSKGMTVRQKVLKAIYPLWMGWSRMSNKRSKVVEQNRPVKPHQSLYDLNVTLNSGEKLSMGTYRGKKILIVNTASDCGYTNQYADLQELYEKNKDKLVIIGFPANDFKEQEKGSDEEIARFCKSNYDVNFPLVKKSTVIKGQNQNEVFRWLTDKTKNGWNNKAPSWNFSKYLVNEEGELTHYFDPAISPLSSQIRKLIE